MMRLKIVPSFLKRLDHYLLLNYRLLWISKVHYVLFYSVFMFLLGGGLIYAYPLTTASSLPNMDNVLLISSLLVAPACLYWVYWQTLYGIEKWYGLRFRFIAYLRFALYLICFVSFGVLPFAFTAMVHDKIAKLTDVAELVDDVNALNIGNLYMPSEIGNDTLWYDTRTGESILPRTINDGDSIYESKRRFDTLTFLISNKDTLCNFSGYNFDFFSSFITTMSSQEELRKFENLRTNNVEMFFKRQSEAFMLNAIRNYIKAFNKYSQIKIRQKPEDLLKSYLAKKVLLPRNIGFEKFRISEQLETLSGFNSRSYFASHKKFDIIVPFIIFSLSVLLFSFQYVRRLDFGIGIVALMVGSFLLAFVYGLIETLMTNYYGFEDVLYTNRGDKILITFVSSILFILLGISLKNHYLSTNYTKFKSIILVCTSIAGFIGLLFIGLGLANFYIDSVIEKYVGDVIGWHYEQRNNYMTVAFYSVFAFYFVVFVPLFHTLFMRLRSLPKKV